MQAELSRHENEHRTETRTSVITGRSGGADHLAEHPNPVGFRVISRLPVGFALSGDGEAEVLCRAPAGFSG
jgi:hypothetical protein